MIFRLNAAIRLFPRSAFAESEGRGGRKKNRREKKKSLERSNEEREAGIVEEEEEEVEDRFDRSKYRERRGGEKREREKEDASYRRIVGIDEDAQTRVQRDSRART